MKFTRLLESKVFQIVFICVAAILVYSNTFDVPFMFDDYGSIVENPFIRDFSYFTDVSKTKGFVFHNSMVYRYVGYLTLAVNFHMHGFEVTGYHVVNLLIHIFSSLVLYYFVLLAFRTPRMEGSALAGRSASIAFLASLLFAVHPVQTQAVTYIVQRFASLAGLFYMLAMVGYIRARLSPTWKGRIVFLLAGVLAALLAMKTKQNTFTLPLAVGLFEMMFFGGKKHRKALMAAVVLLVAGVAVLGALTLFDPAHNPLKTVMSYMARGHKSWQTYFITELRVMATYLRLFALPVNLNLDYDYPIARSFASLPVLLSFGLCLVLTGWGIFLTRRSAKGEPAWRLVAFAVFFFFVSLSIESSFIPLHPIYEHRLYLPGFGVFGGVSAGIFILLSKLKNRTVLKAATAGLALLVLALCILTFTRNAVWADPVTLWQDVTEKSPRKPRSHLNLGQAYDVAGNTDLALKEFEKAVEISPNYWDAHYLLGTAYFERGRMDLAVKHYEQAARLNPRNVNVLLNLGIGYLYSNNIDRSIETLKQALKLNPYYSDVHINLSMAYTQKGDTANAKKHSEAARRLRQGAR